jgi:phosphoglycerate kinase
MMDKASVRDIVVDGKRVLVRVDFNVPMDEPSGRITDDSRIRAALPTIRHLIEDGAMVILASHLGRPDGRVVESMRMAPVARRLAELLGRDVTTTSDCVGLETETAAAGLKRGGVLLIENLRFHAEEEANAPDFARALARLADIYVDDAFGTAHRKHASIVGVARDLPSVAGLLMERELTMLGGLLDNPAHPFCALLGGAKISDKIGLLRTIMGKVDRVLIGGGMAATFLRARGLSTGLSLTEEDRIETAAEIMAEADKRKIRLLLPVDVLVADRIAPDASRRTVPSDEVPSDMRIVDIGPKAMAAFKNQLDGSRAVFWNGPMGIYEVPVFSAGTRAMAIAIASLQASTVIGGGSTADIVASLGLEEKMTFVSTGGGASLSFLSGEKLPGVEALWDKGRLRDSEMAR